MRSDVTLIQRLSERIWLLIVRRDIDLLEITYGVMMVGWGIQLLLPWETFRSSPGYAILAAIMPESYWGFLLTWVGAMKVGAYLLNQWRARLAATLIAVMIWTFLSVAFGFANPYGTGIVIYPTLAFTSAIVFWRLLTHRVSDA